MPPAGCTCRFGRFTPVCTAASSSIWLWARRLLMTTTTTQQGMFFFNPRAILYMKRRSGKVQYLSTEGIDNHTKLPAHCEKDEGKTTHGILCRLSPSPPRVSSSHGICIANNCNLIINNDNFTTTISCDAMERNNEVPPPPYHSNTTPVHYTQTQSTRAALIVVRGETLRRLRRVGVRQAPG